MPVDRDPVRVGWTGSLVDTWGRGVFRTWASAFVLWEVALLFLFGCRCTCCCAVAMVVGMVGGWTAWSAGGCVVCRV